MGHTETGVSERRCQVTGNPCGTDTWAHGSPCTCGQCVLYAWDRVFAAEEAQKRLIEEGEIRRSFYELTVKERDLERIRVNRLVEVGISAEEMKVHLDAALRRVGQLETAARGVVASEHDDLDTGSVNWVAVLREAVEQLRKVLGDE